jgi:hydroxymethylpyrimidine/phosphomethylpyrimidine kinase
MSQIPVMLSIAGSDPSGGAGIQADLKTATALGVYGATVVTALTVQNTLGVTDIHAVPADFITAQYDAVVGDLDVRSVKIGMLGSVEVVEAVAAMLRRRSVPTVVLDPVMVATSGDRLVPADAEVAIRGLLLPLATVVTPNVPEAAALTGLMVGSEDEMVAAGHALVGLGATYALVKGGHLGGDQSVDVLVSADGVLRLEAPRVETSNTHGTGCTLSSAVASCLAKGEPVVPAVTAAKDYLTRALVAGADLRIGHGNGPVDHRVQS